MYFQGQIIKKRKFPSENNKLKELFQNKKLEEFVQEIDRAQKQGEKFSQDIMDVYQDFKTLIKKSNTIAQKLRSSKEGWKINKIDQRTELAVKVTGTNVELRYQGVLSKNIENLGIMLYQVNLFNHWMPFCDKGEDYGQVSPLQKVGYIQYSIPFLTKRYTYFYGLGIDKVDINGTVLVYGQGFGQDQELLKKFNIKHDKSKFSKMEYMDLKYFVFQTSYKSQNQFYLRCYGQLDSHMSFIPEWLVNLVVKQMGAYLFDKVIKQSANFKGTVWQKQLLKDKDNPYYEWLHNKIKNWSQKGQKQIKKSNDKKQ